MMIVWVTNHQSYQSKLGFQNTSAVSQVEASAEQLLHMNEHTFQKANISY